ncbi:MAG TPA: condensation domain-containing protein, partial [Chitinophagaceae bacterium]|nr:condensation domain-containing protein [Chitinophagaceae bacterium]
IPTYIQTNEKILINTVPSVVGVLLSNHVNLQAVTTLNMAGEPIPKHYIDTLLQQYKNIHIRNLYGPSEDTTYSTVYKINDNNTALIGVPIANTEVYIINEQLQLQPIGVVGEICIAGSGLARGYLYKPELTAEKFVSNPFKSGEHMYKTGDIGRWLENGNIEFMGRKDDQVKIRGYRIELGEIETTLQKHENIEAAVVTTKINSAGEKELIAYIVNKKELNKADIRNYLSDWLPAYALPAHYIFLKQLPLTPNGKVDKKKLPKPETALLSDVSTYVAPSTDTEKQLAYIWKQILDIEKIGTHDDFFMLGGQSLKATRLISQIHKQFNVKLALEDVFTTTTLQNQAALIDQSNPSIYNNIQPAQKQDSYPLTSSQYRLWILSQLEEGNMAYSMPGVYVIEGALNYTALEKAFDNLIERHEILRTVFNENEQSAIRQYIKQPAEIHFKIDYQNIQSINISDELVEQHIQQVIQQPFNLANGPLLRVTVYQLASNKWIFVYVMHHIISDGWSLNVLMQEWLALYNAHATNQSNALQPLRIQYKDYAVWEQQQLESESLQKHKQYWMGQFKTGIPVLDVSLKSRPSTFSYKGDTLSFIIDENKTDHLTQITN